MRRAPAAALAVLLAAPLSARGADVEVGLRGGYAADAGEPFVGGEVLVRAGARVQVAPSVEVLLVDEGHSLALNADALFDLTCSCSPRSFIWAGGGLGVGRRGGAGLRSRTDLGLNLLTGVSVKVGRARPYAQLKGIVRRRPELMASLGLRF